MVFDGGSIDGSVEIIKKYERHLTYWESVPDRGQSHAINKGLSRASGDVFNWLNSDDYYQPGALAQVGSAFRDPSTWVLCGRSRLFEDGSPEFRVSKGTDVYTGNLAKTIALARIDQPETFYRMEAVRKMGNLNEGLHFVMDKEWWIKYLVLFGLEGVIKSEEVLVNFRLHPNSKTVSSKAGFLKDSLILTHALALKCNGNSLAELIATEYSPGTNIQLPDPPIEWRKQIVSYLSLYLADYFYYHKREYQKARSFFNLVNPDALDKVDLAWFKRVRLRLQIPDYVWKVLGK